MLNIADLFNNPTNNKTPKTYDTSIIPTSGKNSIDYASIPNDQLTTDLSIYDEAVFNSKTDNNILDTNNMPISFEDLDNAGYYDTFKQWLSNNGGVYGKLLRKTEEYSTSEGTFNQDPNNPFRPSDYGKEIRTAQQAREKDANFFTPINPFIPGPTDIKEKSAVPYYDQQKGKWYLKLVNGSEQDLKKLDNNIYSAYGLKPFNKNFLSSIYTGLANTLGTTKEGLVNFAELTTDLGEATLNKIQGGEFKSSEGLTDKLAAEERIHNRINNLANSFDEDNKPFSSIEGLSNGIGSGVASLLQFAGIGKAVALTGTRYATTMGMLGAGAVLNTGEAYSSAKQAGLPEEDAAVLSLAVGAINTALEQKFGSNLLNKYLVSGKGASKIPKIILSELGEDITEASLNKGTKGILSKVMKSVDDFTKLPVVGTAGEETFEEWLQTLIGKSAEVFYDNIYGKNKKIGEGKFGTSFNQDTWGEIFGSALIGGIMGAGGGAFIPKETESNTIFPYIANGQSDKVIDHLDILKNSGKINENQYNAYTERVNNLDRIWNKNNSTYKDSPESVKNAALTHIDKVFKLKQEIADEQKRVSKIESNNELTDVAKAEQVKKVKQEIETKKTELEFRNNVLVELPNNPELADFNKVNQKYKEFTKTKKLEQLKTSLKLAETTLELEKLSTPVDKIQELDSYKQVENLKKQIEDLNKVEVKEETTPTNEPPKEKPKPKEPTKTKKQKKQNTPPQVDEDGIMETDIPPTYEDNIPDDYNQTPDPEEQLPVLEDLIAEANNTNTSPEQDIERRRQEELGSELPSEIYNIVKNNEDLTKRDPANFYKNTIDKINAKYDAELAALTTPKESTGESNHRGPGEYTTVFNVGDEGRTKLQKYINTVPDLAEKLLLTVTKNTRNTNQTKFNDNVLNNPSKYNYALSYTGDVIGYIPSATRFAYNDGTIIDPNTLTEDQYIELFQPNEGQTLTDFRKAYNGLKKFNDFVDKQMQNKEELIFTNAELNQFGKIDFSHGFFEYEDTELTLFSDKIPYVDDIPLIAERKPIFDESGQFKVGIKPAESLLGNMSSEYQEAFDYLENMQFSKMPNRYMTLAEDKGGMFNINGKKYSWIALNPKELGDTNFIFNELFTASKAFKETKPTKDELDNFNSKLNNKFFISAPARIDNKSISTQVTLTLNTFGNYRLSYDIKGEKNAINLYAKSDEVKSFPDLIKKLNKEKNSKKNLDKYPLLAQFNNLTNENFKLSIPDDGSIDPDQVLNYFTSVVSLNIKTDQNLEIIFKEDNLIDLSENSELSKDPDNIKSQEDIDEIDYEDSGDPNKYSTSIYSEEYIKDFNKAVDQIRRILPDNIQIQDFNTVTNNLREQGVAFGMFKNDIIYIMEGSPEGTQYHEAFHAVFNMLLPVEEARGLLDLVKKNNKSIKSDRGAEEFLADEFAKYKLKNTSNNLFTRLYNLIKNFYNFLRGNDEIVNLFYKIDRGDYKRSKIIRNSYGTFYKILPRLNGKNKKTGEVIINPPVTSSRSEQIINTVAAMIRLDYQNNPYNKPFNEVYSEILDKVLKEQYDLYNPKNYTGLSNKQITNLASEQLVFHPKNNTAKELIKEEVKKRLNIFENQDDEFFEDKNSEENLNKQEKENELSQERNRDLNQENIGGWAQLSKELRRDIALTLYEDTSTFGIPVKLAVNPKMVYDGLTKAMSNTPNDSERLYKFLKFRENSEQSKYYINRKIQEFNLKFDNVDGELTYTIDETKSNQLQQILKGFDLYSVDQQFTQWDRKKKVTDNYAANWNGVDKIQIQKWQNNFLFQELDKAKRKLITADISKAKQLLVNRNTTDVAVSDIVGLLSSSGLELSNGYIKYILLSNPNRKTNSNDDNMFVSAYTYNMYYEFADFIKFLDEFSSSISNGHNPYSSEKVQVGDKTEDTGVVSRLTKVAKDNSIFDETVVMPTMSNAEGKTIYQYQQSTFDILEALRLRRKTKEDLSEFQKNNFLFNNEKFQLLKPNLEIKRAEGLRELQTKLDKETKEFIEDKTKDQKDGTTFGNFGTREFLIYLYSLYANQEQRNISGEKLTTFLTPVTIMESSNSFDLIELPVYQLYNSSGLTETFKDIIFNEISNEYNRIQRVKTDSGDTIINNYNNGSMRGTKFFLFDELLSYNSDLRDKLLTNSTPTELKEEIYKQIEAFYDKEINDQLKMLVDESILSYNDGKYTNNFLDKRYERILIPGQADIFENKDLKANIGQAYLNNFINSLSYNQLIFDDPAIGIKDSIDWFKRAKGINASGSNIYRKDFTHTKFIIFGKKGKNGEIKDFTDTVYSYKGRILDLNDPNDKALLKSSEPDEVDILDAQGYGTAQYFKEIAKSLGRLDNKLLPIYDKIIAGDDISTNEFKMLKDFENILNSKKLVGFDNQRFLKMSVTLLSKNMVGYKDKNNRWYSRPGYEELFNLLNQMELQGIHLAGPPSMSKKMIKNPVYSDSDNNITIDPSRNIDEIDNHYVRLQQENPSNKLFIKDPTQMVDIIDSEQDDSTPIVFPNNLKINTVGKLRQFYQDQRALKTDILYDQYRNLLFKLQKGVWEPDLADFQKSAIETLEKTGSSQQLLDFFMVDNNNKPEYNLNNPGALNKFTNLFHSHFSNVFSHKVPGYKTTLQSDWGISLTEYNGKIITRDMFDHDKETYEKLHRESLELAKVGQSNGFSTRKLQWNQRKNGKIYSEVIVSKHFMEQYKLKPGDEIPEEISMLFGVRIPSQDKHSALVLKIVDTLPNYYGSNMIFPKEIIKLTGSDFDIDSFYIHRPDHYIKDGKFRVFGNNIDDKFEQYLIYNYTSNPLVRSLMSEAVIDTTDTAVSYEEDDILSTLAFIFNQSTSVSQVNPKYSKLEQALRRLGLPSTRKEFDKESKNKELNIGTINNNILNSKILLHTNRSISDEISKTPATVDAIQQVVKDINKLKGINSNSSKDIFGFNGLTRALFSNKAGSESIGAAVNSTKVYTWFNKYNIRLNEEYQFTVDGEHITGYDRRKDINGIRIMDTLSTLTSAMTDNAKHGFVSQINLIINALSTVSNMVSLGVPLYPSILLINVPGVYEYLQKSRRRTVRTDDEQKGKNNIYDNIIKKYEEKLLDLGYIDQVSSEEYSIDTKELEKLFNAEETIESVIANIKALQFYKFMEEQTEYFSDAAQILKLTKGMDATFSDNNRVEEKYKRLTEDNPVFDIKPALEGDKIHTTNYEKFLDIRDKAKHIFIERSDLFNEVFNIAKGQYKENLTNERDIFEELRRNLLTYLTIKGFTKYFEDTKGYKYPNKNIVLNHEIAAKNNTESLKDMFDRLYKEIPEFKNNPLIKLLGKPIRKNGIDKIQFNSRTKGNKSFENKFIDGFTELYNDPRTKTFSNYLFQYLLSKDGLQYKNESFLGYITAFMFKPISDSIDRALSLYSQDSMFTSDEEFKQIFGNTKQEVITEFLQLNGRDFNNTFNWGYTKSIPKSSAFKLEKGVLSIDMFGNTDYNITEASTYTQFNVEDNNQINKEVEETKDDNKKILKSNIESIKSVGIFPLVYVKKEDKTLRQFVFPLTIKVSTDIYELKSVDKKAPKFDNEFKSVGTQAIYAKERIIGNNNVSVYSKSIEENLELESPTLKASNKGPVSDPFIGIENTPDYKKQLDAEAIIEDNVNREYIDESVTLEDLLGDIDDAPLWNPEEISDEDAEQRKKDCD